MAGLVTFLRDGVRDLPTPQVLADLPRGVRPVGKNVIRTGAGVAAPDPGNPDTAHDLTKHRRVATLPTRDHCGQDVEGRVDREVDLCGQAAA